LKKWETDLLSAGLPRKTPREEGEELVLCDVAAVEDLAISHGSDWATAAMLFGLGVSDFFLG
jgi:hypothetical protein